MFVLSYIIFLTTYQFLELGIITTYLFICKIFLNSSSLIPNIETNNLLTAEHLQETKLNNKYCMTTRIARAHVTYSLTSSRVPVKYWASDIMKRVKSHHNRYYLVWIHHCWQRARIVISTVKFLRITVLCVLIVKEV